MTDNQYKPVAFWSWNGIMDEQEMRSQISGFKEQDFGGFFVHARAGLELSYMQKDWFNAVRIVIDQAKQKSMQVWLYDEDGWPSGFGGGAVYKKGISYQQKKLNFEVYKGQNIDESLVIAIFQIEKSSFKKVGSFSECDFNNYKYIYFYYSVIEHYVDLLDKKVTEAFIECTYNRYYEEFSEEFGKTIYAIFTDEPQIAYLPWSFILEKEFVSKNGYSLIDNLPCLAYEFDGYTKIRHDFGKTVATLFLEGYTKQLYEWCDARNIKFAGHFGGEDGLCYQLITTGGSVMPHYEYMHIPGIDHLGRRLTSPLLTKQVASIAAQLSKPEVISETFGCSGWNMSYQDMIHIWSWQAFNGVSTPTFHLSAYSMTGNKKRDYPPSFSYHSSLFNELHNINNYFANLNKKLATAIRQTDILVMHPISSGWCLYKENTENELKIISNEFRILSENLLKIQKDFDYGDELLIEKYGVIKEDKFIIKDKAYSIIFVPEMLSLEKATVNLLKEYAQNDGRIFFINRVPELIDGVQSKEIKDLLSYKNVIITYNKMEILKANFEYYKYSNYATIQNLNSKKLDTNIFFSTRRVGNEILILLFNNSTNAVSSCNLVINDTVNVYRIDFEDNRKNQLPVVNFNNKTQLDMDIEFGEFVVLSVENKENVFVKTPINKAVNKIIKEWQLEEKNENSFTIDYAKLRVEDEKWSERMPIVELHEKVFKIIEKKQKSCMVTVSYSFHNDFNNIPQDLKIAFEKANVKQARFNDIVIQSADGWFFDKDIKTVNVSNIAKKGNNLLELDYYFESYKVGLNLDEIFQSEVNRFHFPIEIENVYVTGSFDTKIDGRLQNEDTDSYVIKVDNFTLIDKTNKTVSKECTNCGLWFYRGEVSLKTTVDISMAKIIMFNVHKPNTTYLKLFINGRYVKTIYKAPFNTDITEYVHCGQNEFELIVVASNRNLLGPHHHISGENIFVGPSTFKGKKGWEDFVDYAVPDITWSDHYCFVKLGFTEYPEIRYFD